ncbi:MAG: U32 family peptidase [Hornefia sp.]|nr:U32 family peptidase [Hornefia sp.]
MEKIELLAPAGDLEKLKIAVTYGADAVYFGGEAFSLRAGAGNFTVEEIEDGVKFAHQSGCKCYMTLNIYAHNEDIKPLEKYLKKIKHIPIDAFLISDPGILSLVKEILPGAELHLSTQANMTNYRTAKFWYDMGVRRLVVARELSIEEIRKLSGKIPEDMTLESFVHGAMCISYSGRCLLSNVMTQRDANRGLCAHPCRYRYAVMEEKRPGEYYPVEEDARGTYIFNSKDLCMIKHIPELISCGIASAKIEGRIKSLYYVATVIHAYRQAIDAYYENPDNYTFKEEWFEELQKASHREFTTGFYFNKTTHEDQNYETSAYIKEYSFIGIVKEYDPESGYAVVQQRNKMVIGDEIEIFGPAPGFSSQKLSEMYDAETGEKLESAPHPKQLLRIKMEKPVAENYILRKKI